jgi:nucleoside-diphosphate-sugar epimerase
MKIAITGGSGFIGNYVMSLLLSAGHEVIALQRRPHVNKTVKTVEFDLMQYETLTEHDLTGVDTVIHLAASVHRKNVTSHDHKQMNFRATRHLYEISKKVKVKKFIFISTVGVYGLNQFNKVCVLNSDIDPQTPYATSKFEAEEYLRSNGDAEVITSILRVPLVYGKDAPGNLGLIKKFASKFRVLPFGRIHNRRSLVLVEDLADLISRMSQRVELYQGTHLIADPEPASTSQISERIFSDHQITGFNLPIPKSCIKLFCFLVAMPKLYEQLCGDLVFKSSIKLKSRRYFCNYNKK